MIIGDLQNWKKEKDAFHPLINKGIEYILSTDISALEPGRYEVQGSDIYALVQEVQTKPIIDAKPESHARYIDIQYLYSGEEEVIGVSRVHPENEVSENSFETKDIAFYHSVESESYIRLLPGMFAVFFPSDVHRPCCYESKPGMIKKVVIKIDSLLLEQRHAVTL